MLFDASRGLVDIVERMHRTIQLRPGATAQSSVGATPGISGFVYQSIRSSMRLIGHGLDSALAHFEGQLPAGETTPEVTSHNRPTVASSWRRGSSEATRASVCQRLSACSQVRASLERSPVS